jgi:hypothetical protein
MGNTIHAPSLKEVVRATVCGEEPAFTLIVSLREVLSQSSA